MAPRPPAAPALVPRAGAPDSPLRPNLFVVGASKAGTSALHAHLGAHPLIRMSRLKEPCFFVDRAELARAWPIMARHPASHDWDAYLGLFAGGEGAAWRGEASVYYAQSPHRGGVPERIARAAPDARILYLVREPVTRAVAHYWQRAKEFQEPLPLDRAVREHAIYRDTSDYPMQLARYRAVFPAGQIRVVVTEELRADPRGVLGGLFDWLGLPPHALTPEELAERHLSPPTSRRPRFPFVPSVRDSRPWAAARRRLPGGAVDWLRRQATVPFDKAEVDEGPARAWLGASLAGVREGVEGLIGRRIDAWDRRD